MNKLVRASMVLCIVATLSGCDKPAETREAVSPTFGPPVPIEIAQAKANKAAMNDPRCTKFFYQGRQPTILNAKFSKDTTALCYEAFYSLNSGLSRTPIWSAEYLTPTIVQGSRGLARVDAFHPDERIPATQRAELADYLGSNYDRGHMAPSADMPNADAQAESFTLGNIVPQKAGLNRGSWSELEHSIRVMAYKTPVYVVTGPIFIGSTKYLGGRVLVPTQTWKAIYAPGKGAVVFVASNEDTPKWQALSVEKFTQGTGIDPFPALDPALRKGNLSMQTRPTATTARSS